MKKEARASSQRRRQGRALEVVELSGVEVDVCGPRRGGKSTVGFEWESGRQVNVEREVNPTLNERGI
jgi:hypothetical protein